MTPELLAEIKKVFPVNLKVDDYLIANKVEYDSEGAINNYPLLLFYPNDVKSIGLSAGMQKINNSCISTFSEDSSKLLIRYNEKSSDRFISDTRGYAAIFDRFGHQLFGIAASTSDGASRGFKFSDDLNYYYYSEGDQYHVFSTETGKEQIINVSGVCYGLRGDYVMFKKDDSTTILYNLNDGKTTKIDISPDSICQILGNQVVIMEDTSGFGLPTQCFIVNMDGTNKQLLANCLQALVSPDKKYITYFIAYGDGIEQGDIEGSPKAGLYIKNIIDLFRN